MKTKEHDFYKARDNKIHISSNISSVCWCGSTHSWEMAKHGTVNGLTEKEIKDALRKL